MSGNGTKHRMSAVQRTIILSMYLLEENLKDPIAVSDLRRIINKNRASLEEPLLERGNFAVSCKTLSERGYLTKYRDKRTLKVAYRLTEAGTVDGKVLADIYLKSLEEEKQ